MDRRYMLEKINIGYYYYNEEYAMDDFKFVLEESNYKKLDELEENGIIHKLVYYGNGNLCNGWNPSKNVLAKY
jgi:hypothetical protein